ncbi:helix-turn-helix transcriptional regulator [Phenylobacterium sp. LjRoot219]|uniref:helix-turn-helix domain-containing protein n=1 Tax=Phenylobacterium sp. LjRoot219 TaxID=3342283 RepID=UPI003ECDF2C1
MSRFEVDAELELPTARVQLVRLNHPGPHQSLFRPSGVYWMDLCLTPRRPNARARYADHWGPHRFGAMGSIIALPAHEALDVNISGGRHASLICQLRAEAVDRWLPDDFEWSDRRLEACLDIASAPIRGILLRLALELRRPGVASEELAEALVFQLAIEFARYLVAISEPTETGGLAAWRLRTIDKRLAEAGEQPTLAELADLCNMSVRQLTRGFRTSRGCSIGDYMAQSRIEAAKRRLSAGESIKAIATSMGYASQSNFAFAFRRATGVTPSQFRTRVLRGGERQPARA